MGCVRRDFSTFMLLLTVASIPLARSYRPNHVLPGTTVPMAQEKKATHGLEEGNSHGGSVGLSEYEDSARLVPTGPDPLHHNHNPIKPIIKS